MGISTNGQTFTTKVKWWNKPSYNAVHELDDGFIVLSAFHKLGSFYVNNNSDLGETCGTPNNQKLQQPIYPLSPTFYVNEFVSSSSESINTRLSDESETQRDVVQVKLEDVYPQFLKPCMQIDRFDTKHCKTRKTKFKKFLALYRCFSKRVSNTMFSSECRVDGVTTLHALQGDEESDTGVPDPIRKLRIRRAGCY